MTHPNNLAYQQFVKLFIEANQSERKSKQVLISEAMTCWKTNIKKSQKDPFDRSAFNQQIDSLRKKDRKRRQSIELCFLKQKLSSPSPSTSSIKENLPSVFDESEDTKLDENVNPIDAQSTNTNLNSDDEMESGVEVTDNIIIDDADVVIGVVDEHPATVEDDHDVVRILPVIEEKPVKLVRLEK